jgi:hypothetical protein
MGILKKAGKSVGSTVSAAPDMAGLYQYLAALEAAQQTPAAEPAYDDGGLGGGGGYYAAPAPISLDTDPGWIALNQQLDRELALAGVEKDRRAGQITQMRDQRLQDLIPRGEEERRQIEGGLEARGLFGGGQMAGDIARQRANEGRLQTQIQTDAATGLSDLEAALIQQQQAIESRRAAARGDYLSRGYI